MQWAKHRHVLGFLWNSSGQTFRDLYVYDADARRLRRLTDLAAAKDHLNESEAERDTRRRNYIPPKSGVQSFDLAEDGRSAVLAYAGDLYLAAVDGGEPRRLTHTKTPESEPHFSPDGARIAYVSAGQLFVWDRSGEGGTVEQKTEIKAPARLTGFRWSPDGKYLSYTTRVTAGRNLPLPNYSGQLVSSSPIPRDVAGDTPGSFKHYVVESRGDSEARELDTGRLSGQRTPVWSHDSRYLAAALRAPDYKSQEIRVFDSGTGKFKSVYKQKDDRWVQASDVDWSVDSNHLWFTSDESGWQHLYGVNPDGSECKQITRGAWEIHNDIVPHEPQWVGKYLYFSSTAAGPAERHWYRVQENGSAAPERLSQGEGLSFGKVSEDGKARAALHANLREPWDLYVDGQRVTTSPSPAFARQPWAASTFVSYPSLHDHKPVAARLLLPPGYRTDDPGASKHSAIVYVHGAGIATSVLKQWGSYQELRFVFNNALAQQGYVVLEMDYRGSTGYGRDWRTGVYLDMGGPDLDDVLGGVEYLRSLHNIDMSRVGIWGWSYGGFMTAAALFKAPGTFRAGAAFSGVYDWENYNANYSGERLTTPTESPEAYRRSSPITFARNLRDPLLLLHGIVDDNVLFQEAVQLSEKLVAEGKHFEEAFYPEESHAYVREETLRDAFGRVQRFFDQNLRPDQH